MSTNFPIGYANLEEMRGNGCFTVAFKQNEHYSDPVYSAATALLSVSGTELLSHFVRMQRMASMWLAPDAYTASFPKEGNAFNTVFEVSEPLHSEAAKTQINKRRDDAFLSDVIRMLDGPEQRAAEEAIRSALSSPVKGETEKEASVLQQLERMANIAEDRLVEIEALRVENERLKIGLARSTAMRTSSGGGEQPSLSIYFADLDALNLFQDGVRKLCAEIIEEDAVLQQQGEGK